MEGLQLELTVDGLLGTGKVNRLDAAHLLERGADSGLGGSSRSSVQGRDEGTSLHSGGGQLARNLAGSTSSRS